MEVELCCLQTVSWTQPSPLITWHQKQCLWSWLVDEWKHSYLNVQIFSFFWDRVYLCNSSSCSQSSLSWISKAFRVLSSRGNNTEILNVLVGQCLVEVVNAWPCHNRSLWLLNCRVTTAVTKCWCDYFWHSIWEKIQVRKRHQKHSTRNGKVSCWIYFHNFFFSYRPFSQTYHCP